MLPCQHDLRLSSGSLSAGLPIICICGPSAAGKTTFTAALATRLRELGHQPLKIACDDYYRSDWSPHPRFGYDTVDAIDGEALLRDLSDARSRGLSTLRTYDMRSRSVGARALDSPYDLILLEGAYGPQMVLASIPPTVLVYIQELLLLRLWRRLNRDVRHRKRPIRYVIRQMLLEMLPGESLFIHPLRDQATLVIRNQPSALKAVVSALDPC